jgi:hypothetical protein
MPGYGSGATGQAHEIADGPSFAVQAANPISPVSWFTCPGKDQCAVSRPTSGTAGTKACEIGAVEY